GEFSFNPAAVSDIIIPSSVILLPIIGSSLKCGNGLSEKNENTIIARTKYTIGDVSLWLSNSLGRSTDIKIIKPK
ncbi:hypothetical protein D5R95_00665, partial [Methanosalsum natronophilum]